VLLDKRIRIDWHLFYLVGNYLAKQSFELGLQLGFPRLRQEMERTNPKIRIQKCASYLENIFDLSF
jgi:hypothetical protein